jgi:hypothetical protein
MNATLDLLALKAFVRLEFKSYIALLTRAVTLSLPDSVEVEAYPVLARILLKLFDREMNSSERLERYGAEDLEVKRVAFTLDQMKKHRLPPVPAKTSDPRHDKFVSNTGGTDVVELDALPPDALQRVIREAIEREIDAEAWNSILELEELEREGLRCKLAQAKIIWEEGDRRD